MYHLLPTRHVSIDGNKCEVLGIKMFATSFLTCSQNLRKANIRFGISVCVSFRLEQLGPEKRDFHGDVTRTMDTLHEDLNTFMIISRSVLLRMRNISDKGCTMVKTFSENLTVYDRMWKNMAEPERPLMTIYYGARALRAG